MMGDLDKPFLGLDWDAFVNEWYLGAPPQIGPDETKKALGALLRWYPSEYEKLGRDNVRAPFMIEPAIRTGLALLACETLDGFNGIARRLERGDRGARFELLLAAGLVSLGYRPELEPVAGRDGEGRRNDAAITVQGTRVYFEAIRAEWSAASMEAKAVAREISNKILGAMEDGSIVIRLAEPPTKLEVDAICEAAVSAPIDTDFKIGEALYVRKNGVLSGERPHDLPEIGAVHGEVAFNGKRQVSLEFPAIDVRLPALMGRKAVQLNRDNINIVVIDVSNIPGRLENLAPQVVGRFQPSLNRRFGAVVLVRRSFPVERSVTVTEWHVIPNPHATAPVPADFLKQIASLDGASL